MHLHTDPVTGIPVDSVRFRERAPRVELSEDPDTATEQTVRVMCDLVKQASRDPLIQRAAQDAAKRFGKMSRNAAEACFWWCKHFLKFRHHGDQFEAWSAQLGDPNTKLQLLIAPDVLIRMRKMEGDCAIYTMMLCAMLEALGIRWQICPAAVNHSTPRIFSHVFARAVFDDGFRESLDASHGKYPGWQVPDHDLLRLWVFDENGGKVGDYSQRFTGLHNYRHSRFARRGLSQGDDIQEGGNYVPPNYDNPTQVFGVDSGWWTEDSGFPSGYPGSVTAPSQNSAQWAQFASNLAKMGFTLAQINSIQPGTVVGANGQILRQNPGYSVPAGASASLNLGSSSNLLVYGGLGLLALFAVSSMFKGGR